MSKCGRKGPQDQIMMTDRNSLNVRCAINHYLSNLKIEEGDRESIVSIVILLEIRSGAKGGEKERRDFLGLEQASEKWSLPLVPSA